MVSNSIYICTLFHARHSRHIFSILMRLPPFHDVANLTLIFAPLFLEILNFRIAAPHLKCLIPILSTFNHERISISESNQKRMNNHLSTTTKQLKGTLDVEESLGALQAGWHGGSRRMLACSGGTLGPLRLARGTPDDGRGA